MPSDYRFYYADLAMLRIEQIDVYSVSLPVVGEPYRYSGGELTAVDSTIVRLTCTANQFGFGESCPLGSTYAAEHALGARAALAQIGPSLIGLDVLQPDAIHRVMNSCLAGHNYAKAAIDVALWDVTGKHLNTRVCDLLGGALTEEVPSYYAVGTYDPDETVRIATDKVEQGFGRLQLKVGGRPVAVDIEMIRKVNERLGSRVTLVADANRAWTTEEALLASNALVDVPIVFEQPCDSWTELERVRSRLKHPLYLDEITTDIESVLRATNEKLCDGFGFKLGRLGGISGLRSARDICQAADLPHTCDDSWGGDIAAAACLHVGATVEPRRNDGTWIAQPYVAEHYDPNWGIAIQNGHLHIPSGPGLGVTPEPECFGSPVATYS